MEDSDENRILPSLEEGSRGCREKKHSTESKPAENDIDPEILSDSESDSDSSETDSSDSSDSDAEYKCTICDKTFSGYLPLKQHEKGSKHKKTLARKEMRKLLTNDDDEEGDGEEYLIEEPFAVCKACAKQFSGPESYSSHLKSKAHKQKKLEASVLKKVKESGEINLDKLKELYVQRKSNLKSGNTLQKADTEEGGDEFDGGEYECKTCEKAFTGLKNFAQHLASKTHAKQVEKRELMSKVVPKLSDKTSDVSVLDVEDDILVCKACSTSFSGPVSAVMHLKSQKHKKKVEKYMRKLEKKKKKAVELKEVKASSSKSETNQDVIKKAEPNESSSEETDDSITNALENSKETVI